MSDEQSSCPPLALLRLQSWLSPAFPTGSYSYSHGLEWAVEAGHIHDRKSFVDWLDADLCYGLGRNEAIFFSEAWRRAIDDDRAKLFEIAELAAAFRGAFQLQSHLAAVGSNIPIIFFTAYDHNEFRQRALQAGAVAFLGKPFSDELLLQTIRAALRHDNGGTKTS